MSENHIRCQDVSRPCFTVEQLGQVEIARLNAILEIIPENVLSILDIGCGEGLITNPLAKESYTVIGCDISYPSLQYVQSLKTQASIECLPFDAQSFDLVLSSSVLEHLTLDLLQKCVKELERVSRKYILISTPYKEVLWKSLTKCPNCASIYHQNLHLHIFDEVSLAALFQNSLPVDISYGIAQDWKSGFLVWIEQHIFNRYAYSRSEIKCPVCGIIFSKTKTNLTLQTGSIDKNKNKRGTVKKLAIIFNYVLSKLFIFSPKKPSHIVILLTLLKKGTYRERWGYMWGCVHGTHPHIYPHSSC